MRNQRSTAFKAIVMCLCATAALALACSDKKSTTPGPVITPVHAPLPDAEAEDMAVAMSGELSAPQDLYGQVGADLGAIRAAWAQRIPEIASITHTPKWRTDRIEVSVDVDTYAALSLGFPAQWDSLNQALRIDRATLHDSTHSLTLTFDARLSPQVVAQLYQGLPGVRWAKMIRPATTVVGPSSVDGYLETGSRLYLFSRPVGACDKLCPTADLWLFRVTGSQVDSVGGWRHEDPTIDLDTLQWWVDASKVRDLALGPGSHLDFPDSDQVAPGVITGVGGQGLDSRSIIVRWNSTGDDGNSGLATSYQISILGPDSVEDTIPFAGSQHLAGKPESLVVDNLLPNWTYRVVVRAADEQDNWSIWSEAAQIRTLSPWTSFTSQNSSLANNVINAVAVDQTDRVWCATNGGGINRFDGKFWSVILTIDGHSLVTSKAIEFDPGREIIWCGAAGGALCGIRVTGPSHLSFSSNAMGFSGSAIIAIEVAPNRDVWCSDGVNGVVRWDGQEWTSYRAGDSSLVSNVVWDIESDADGNIWIATSGGVSRFDGQSWTNFTTTNSGIGVNLVRCLAITAAGTLWCGHQDNLIALSSFTSGKWITHGLEDSLPSTHINAIAVGPPYSPWLGTTLGLARQGSIWEPFTTESSPIIDNTITTLAFDSDNILWIGTPRGLSRYELPPVGR